MIAIADIGTQGFDVVDHVKNLSRVLELRVLELLLFGLEAAVFHAVPVRMMLRLLMLFLESAHLLGRSDGLAEELVLSLFPVCLQTFLGKIVAVFLDPQALFFVGLDPFVSRWEFGSGQRVEEVSVLLDSQVVSGAQHGRGWGRRGRGSGAPVQVQGGGHRKRGRPLLHGRGRGVLGRRLDLGDERIGNVHGHFTGTVLKLHFESVRVGGGVEVTRPSPPPSRRGSGGRRRRRRSFAQRIHFHDSSNTSSRFRQTELRFSYVFVCTKVVFFSLCLSLLWAFAIENQLLLLLLLLLVTA